jgi:hypothetical protein
MHFRPSHAPTHCPRHGQSGGIHHDDDDHQSVPAGGNVPLLPSDDHDRRASLMRRAVAGLVIVGALALTGCGVTCGCQPLPGAPAVTSPATTTCPTGCVVAGGTGHAIPTSTTGPTIP